jgi:tRNA threonylcarbamoyladenosine biosynthesis protein TsaB
MTARGPILLIDTATTQAVIALGGPDGTLIEQRRWTAGYRHGEELLARIDGLLRDRSVALADLGGLAVGTGPGAFTGLRVGIATAKGLAHALRLPIVGVATGLALLDAAGASASGASASDASASSASTGLVLLQPAGPNDRVLLRAGEVPRIVPGGANLDIHPSERLVAVDLAGKADDAAVTLGEAAVEGLAAAMLATAARRLAAGDDDDLATLVPEYVTLPRGVRLAITDDGVEVSGGNGGPA